MSVTNLNGSSIAGPTAIGFRDPAHDAQACFRAVMNALAEPGTIRDLQRTGADCPGFSSAMTALALTLLDYETTAWIDDGALPDVATFLRFQTGARIVDLSSEATFAFVTRPLAMPRLAAFSQGTLDYPDRSTTILIEVDTLAEASGWLLSGPGIATSRRLGAAPLPATFTDDLVANRAQFPCGVDVVLCSGSRIAAVPRSTRVVLSRES